MVIKLKKTKKYKNTCKNEQIFYKLVKDAFKQKRKNLRNNLKNYNNLIIEEVLNKYNKNMSKRAEEIEIEEFIDISNKLSS